mmetsp:Transcript_42878/g.49290  ORF Transcript_42878/g.49290 Transcript_42878/m.49290 type:complete len:96 (+) Transcript_42878:753-1040(+)
MFPIDAKAEAPIKVVEIAIGEITLSFFTKGANGRSSSIIGFLFEVSPKEHLIVDRRDRLKTNPKEFLRDLRRNIFTDSRILCKKINLIIAAIGTS